MAKDYKSIPSLLKHCTVAIYRSGKVKGSDKEKFVSAWKIARAHLTKHGYLADGSEEGPVENIRFTPKGAGKTRPHNHEGVGKSKLFDSLSYLLVEHDMPKNQKAPVMQSTPSSGKSQPPGPPVAPGVATKEQRERRAMSTAQRKVHDAHKRALAKRAPKTKLSKVKRAKRR